MQINWHTHPCANQIKLYRKQHKIGTTDAWAAACRSSAEPEDQLEAVAGRKGIIRCVPACADPAADSSGSCTPCRALVADVLLACLPRRFWDCCGAEEQDAPGCKHGPHVSFDDGESVMYMSQ